MKSIISFLFLFIFSFVCFADSILDHFVPIEKDCPSELIKHLAYYVCYNSITKNPYWVSYRLNSELTKDTCERSGSFKQDPDCPDTVKPINYKDYDIGHMMPAEDAELVLEWMIETFYTSNVCPQRREYNRGIYKRVENLVRQFAMSGRDLVVTQGPLFEDENPIYIGPDKVRVPSAFFKFIYDVKTKEGLAFIIPHKRQSGDLKQLIVSIDELKRRVKIPLWNDDVQIKDWKIDF